MKQIIIIIITAAIFYSCGSRGNSTIAEQAKDIPFAVKPGTIATSAEGFTMKAKLDGKDWAANSMMPPAVASRIVGY